MATLRLTLPTTASYHLTLSSPLPAILATLDSTHLFSQNFHPEISYLFMHKCILTVLQKPENKNGMAKAILAIALPSALLM